MRIFGIIGRPLGHSFSKSYFEAKFEASGLADECRFYNFPLEDIAGLGKVLEEYGSVLCGLSVTIPYKKEILPWLDSVSDEARAVGAVNCVRVDHRTGRKSGKMQGEDAGLLLTGHNTDAHGFEVGLKRLLGAGVFADVRAGFMCDTLDSRQKGLRALVLGTGGASLAVRYVLDNLGIEYTMVSRMSGRNADGETGRYPISYEELTPEIVESHRLIVNATPLGTFPEVEGKPDIPYEAIGSDHYLYDLVYNPATTAFLAEGARRGAATLNGEAMLHAQAEKAWEIWNV